MIDINVSKEVLVIGSGSAGLAASEKIAALGYKVTTIDFMQDLNADSIQLERVSGSTGEFKADLVKRIFEELKSQGVDLNDLKSINEFMQELAQQDPDLMALFESALGGLLPSEEREGIPVEGKGVDIVSPENEIGLTQGVVPEEGPSLMDKNFNLQENILRQ